VNAQQAKQAVLVSMLALIAIAVFRGKSTSTVFKRIWGTGVLGVALSILADFAPAIAGPFAVLTVLGSLTNGGDTAIQNLLGKVPGSSSTGSAPPGVTGPVGKPSGAGGVGPAGPVGPVTGNPSVTSPRAPSPSPGSVAPVPPNNAT
jgi:hypothetical protein